MKPTQNYNQKYDIAWNAFKKQFPQIADIKEAKDIHGYAYMTGWTAAIKTIELQR